MFADVVILDLGGVNVRLRRLSLKEIREHREAFRTQGPTLDETCQKLVREHVKLENGDDLPVDELSFRQLQKLVVELVGIPEGSGISDFIGLLC